MIIYLYVKQHSITGLKYFGKTTSKNPYTYLGSGKRWLNHINKHGKDCVDTIALWKFNSIIDAQQFAISYSIANNIVESNQWANLQIENAVDGAPAGNILSNQTKNKISKALIGKSRTITENHKQKLSDAAKRRSTEYYTRLSENLKGRTLSESHKENLSKSHIGNKHSDQTRAKMKASQALRRLKQKIII